MARCRRRCARALLAVLPLGLSDGGYFGRSFTTLTARARGDRRARAAPAATSASPSLAFAATGLGALVLLTAWVGLSSLWAVDGCRASSSRRGAASSTSRALAAVGVVVDRCVAGASFLLGARRLPSRALAVVGLSMRSRLGDPGRPVLREPARRARRLPECDGRARRNGCGPRDRAGGGARATRARALQARLVTACVLVLGLSGSRGGALALAVGLGACWSLCPRGPSAGTCVGRAASALAVGGGAWGITMAAGGAGRAAGDRRRRCRGDRRRRPDIRSPRHARRCSACLALARRSRSPCSSRLRRRSSFRSAYWRGRARRGARAAAARERRGQLLPHLAASTERSTTNVRDAHSLYLETLSELGPLGLALVLVVVAAPFATAVRGRGDPLVATAAARLRRVRGPCGARLGLGDARRDARRARVCRNRARRRAGIGAVTSREDEG